MTDKTQALYKHAKKRIPAGGQLLSKRQELWAPGQWPAYFSKSKGCETWDLDGRHYYDMATNAVGACLLGYGDPDVDAAVKRTVDEGSICSLNPPEEVELADKLCEIHPWADCARFTRAGGEAAAVAVRIARATTDRSVIAVCGYHGWHDWYLAANLGDDDSLRGHLLPGLNPIGVPRELRNTTFTFTYNNKEQFQHIIDEHGDRLAAVVMEPCRYHDPEAGFLEYVKEKANQAGALLIFDEITIGFRRNFGGAHLAFGVNPDMAIFAKSLGNGYPIAAIIGTEAAMDGAHTSFISSSYWTERIGCVAALEVIKKMETIDVCSHVAAIGELVRTAWLETAAEAGVPISSDMGYPCMAHFTFDHQEANVLKTLYSQYMLAEGYLAAPAIYPTLAHNEEIVGQYREAMQRVFAKLATDLKRDDLKTALRGPEAHSGFKRLMD